MKNLVKLIIFFLIWAILLGITLNCISDSEREYIIISEQEQSLSEEVAYRAEEPQTITDVISDILKLIKRLLVFISIIIVIIAIIKNIKIIQKEEKIIVKHFVTSYFILIITCIISIIRTM